MNYFNPTSLDQLPKEMNNAQSSKILEIWKTHVVDKAEDKRREVLRKQYDAIRRLLPFRNAIVHGMWEWSSAEPEKITSIRVLKDELLSVLFTAEDLGRFAHELARINFKIRYPGLEDYAAEMSKQGGHTSRQFIALTTNSPLSPNDWFGLTPRSGSTQQQRPPKSSDSV